ncbi:prostaglandin E receptor 2a (subtype EP2) [Clinocottus analis]|uniref:prostaglandin E receptor 2a (subtype EP2) n=1 Tax=Clinocottus analis TaxID=304258 RepID=UPI0035C16E98
MVVQEHNMCHSELHIAASEGPLISGIMFGAGLFGNVAALVILEIRRRKDKRAGNMRRRSLFHFLITALVITDLAGTCLISPLVQLSYSLNMTLIGMAPESKAVCAYFGGSMTFFSLATMSLLFSMALERCFAIGYPYLYSRYITRKCAHITIPVMLLLCTLFCLLPSVMFGEYEQYCPGTWCFIDMNPTSKVSRVYANLYATIMLVLVLATAACNGFVMFQLLRMYWRRRHSTGSVMSATRSSGDRRMMSIAEEVEHLILLVFMTIIFIICTMPLVVRVYINATMKNEESHLKDLKALRFISINSIIDPWVFILLSPRVLDFCWVSFCLRPLEMFRSSIFRTPIAKEPSPANLELARPSLDYTEHFRSVETL